MSEIINVKAVPPGFSDYKKKAQTNRAYYNGDPYPYFGFQNWKTEELGPFPRCMPIPKAITRRFALWLFGKPISFKFLNDEKINEFFQKAWKQNKLNVKLTNQAREAGINGAIAIKFHYDKKSSTPLRFLFLSAVDEVKFYYNPHDCDEVDMVRVQYPYYDYAEKAWFWYREEWTKDQFVEYQPVKIDNYGINSNNPYLFTGSPLFPAIDIEQQWEVRKSSKNPYGLIPIILIKNFENDTEFGEGDLFDLWRPLDRINLTYHLMDKSNQLDIDPMKAFIDLEPKEGDSIDTPTAPGSSLDLKSTTDEEGNPKQGKIEVVETQSKIREHLIQYAKEVTTMVFDAVGAVFPRQEHITNKGALTQSVLIQMYAPMLEVVGEKRKSFGEDGIIRLLKTVCMALANLGVDEFKSLKDVNDLSDDKLEFSLTWFKQFEQTEDEKFSEFDRIDRESIGGYLPIERAIKKVADLEEIVLTKEEENECKKSIEEYIEGQRKQPGTGNGEDGNGNGTNGRESRSNNDRGKSNDSRGTESGKSEGSGGNESGTSRQQQRGKDINDAK